MFPTGKTTMLVIPTLLATAEEMIKHSGLPHFIADLKNLFVAFVRVQVCPQMACLGRCIVTLVAFIWLSPLCVKKCVLKWLARENAESH